MSKPSSHPKLEDREFTVMIAMIMALSALAIDIMLPTFGAVRSEFGLPADSTAPAAIVTFFFLGLASAQVFFGPLADRFGRKAVLYAGLVVYVGSALSATLAPTLEMVLVSRFIWGVGAAAPRVVAISMVRDAYEGEAMARTMSVIMSIFVLVPVVAPSVGALILNVASWRWVFGACALFAVAMALWTLRLPESLKPENRLTLRFDSIGTAAKTVLKNRQTIGYALAMTFVFGVFMSYLASSELIVSDVFDRAEQFPYIFGGLAAVMGAAMLANAAIVSRVGLRRLVRAVLVLYVTGAIGLVVLAVVTDGVPAFWIFLIGLAFMLSMHAILIPNFNTLAMNPMGKVAGTAAALIGTISTAGGAALGSVLDRTFDGTVLPFTLGFLGYGIVAAGFVWWAEKGRLFATDTPSDEQLAKAATLGG
ncbi:MAG: multidrug effflux MFS transporter [Acidimicrobiia bacterium]|nr:multidrug effflux MFS transporter [Acidimicrobiia bacterium]